MPINPAYFVNRVVIELSARDITAILVSEEDAKVDVNGATFQPSDDESPRAMAERIAKSLKGSVVPTCSCGAPRGPEADPEQACREEPATVLVRDLSDGVEEWVGATCAERIVAAHHGCQCPREVVGQR